MRFYQQLLSTKRKRLYKQVKPKLYCLFVWLQLARTSALHCASGTRAFVEINGGAASLPSCSAFRSTIAPSPIGI